MAGLEGAHSVQGKRNENGLNGSANLAFAQGLTLARCAYFTFAVSSGLKSSGGFWKNLRTSKLLGLIGSNMYGLSKDLPLSFLIRRELLQVAIGVYQIIFSFDEDVKLSVQAQFNYFDGESD
jgi:hypothetical protein